MKVLVPEHHVDASKDVITVDGSRLPEPEPKVYFALHKPRGFICTNDPRYQGKRAIDLIEGSFRRLYTVGRLDRDTSGLIIITNDGEFAHRLMHPSFGISKEYLVKVDKEVLPAHLAAMHSGTWVEGRRVRPLSVHKVRRNTLKIVVAEGRKHEVRYLVHNSGLEVIELKRIRMGHIVLGTLPSGYFRPIGVKERRELETRKHEG